MEASLLQSSLQFSTLYLKKCRTLFDGQELDKATFDLAALTPLKKEDVEADTSGIKGGFEKFVCAHNGRKIILKTDSGSMDRHWVHNEYLCNQLAVTLDLPVPRFGLAQVSGLPAFMSENFMQDLGPSTLIPAANYIKDWSLESIINFLTLRVKEEKDLSAFVKMCLFDALIGNTDRHGYNISFIKSADELVLAPFYDNVSTICARQDGLDEISNPAIGGKIKTKTKLFPSLGDYIQEFKRLGLAEMVEAMMAGFRDKRNTLLEKMDQSLLPVQYKLLFANRIRRHL